MPGDFTLCDTALSRLQSYKNVWVMAFISEFFSSLNQKFTSMRSERSLGPFQLAHVLVILLKLCIYSRFPKNDEEIGSGVFVLFLMLPLVRKSWQSWFNNDSIFPFLIFGTAPQ